MENKMIFVTSASDNTLVINVPSIPVHRVWKKRGNKFPIYRLDLVQAFYDPSVEFLFKEGLLYTDDKEFMLEVGLLENTDSADSVESQPIVKPLTINQMNRIIKLMPLSEVKKELEKLTRSQIEEVADYAIANYKDLSLDRVDILAKASGKNIMKAIEHLRAGA